MASGSPDFVPISSFVSAPVGDPNAIYPPPPDELKDVNFDLTKPLLCGSGSVEDRGDTLIKLSKYLRKQQSNYMGFQGCQHIGSTEVIAQFLPMLLNNIGDPFVEGNSTVNTKTMERAVLDYYASLWNARWPHNPDQSADPNADSYWGFLLTMGSTEGNMYALWNARDYLGGKLLLIEPNSAGIQRLVYRQAEVPAAARNSRSAVYCENFFSPVAFYSEDTHYSFAKATRMIQLPLFSIVGNEKYKGQCPKTVSSTGEWPDEVPSLDEGVIDVEKLADLVEFFAAKGHPIFVNLNYGTTFKGAYDDVKKVIDTLTPIFSKYGLLERKIEVLLDDGTKATDTRTGYWIHVDGALGAAYMPYLKMAKDNGLTFEDGTPLEDGPDFDFRLGIHSIAMSGHKWMGATGPCGVFMSKRKYQIKPPSDPIYIGTPDTTFAGSRNGFSVLFFWTYLSRKTLDEQIQRVISCFETVRYIEKSLKAVGEELKLDLWVARSPAALTVRFKQLNADLVHKYSISNESLLVNGVIRYYSHVFAMEHVTKTLVDSFVSDIRTFGARAFADQEAKAKARKAAAPVSAAVGGAPLVSVVPFEGRGFSGN